MQIDELKALKAQAQLRLLASIDSHVQMLDRIDTRLTAPRR